MMRKPREQPHSSAAPQTQLPQHPHHSCASLNELSVQKVLCAATLVPLGQHQMFGQCLFELKIQLALEQMQVKPG